MRINRRRFLRNSALGAAGLGLSQSLLGRGEPLFAQGTGNRAIVVVNLFGGNDGLSTVVEAFAPPVGGLDGVAHLSITSRSRARPRCTSEPTVPGWQPNTLAISASGRSWK